MPFKDTGTKFQQWYENQINSMSEDKKNIK